MRHRGINLVANALAQSTDHILSFFHLLRTELAFYVGCLNLHDRLAALEVPAWYFHTPEPPGERSYDFRDLRDVCLALTMEQKIVGNALLTPTARTSRSSRVPIRAGKSSFLRSIGAGAIDDAMRHVRRRPSPSPPSFVTVCLPTTSGKRTRR